MPLHYIIDNRSEKLVDHINRIFASTEAARFAVGYFFLSGLTPIAEKLDKVKEMRLLIGNTTNRETLEQLAEGYQRLELVAEAAEAQAYPKRTETEKMAAETAANVRTSVELMDQTDEGEALVKNLARMIEEKRLVVWYDGEGAIPHPRSGCIGWPWATPTGPDPKERADPAGVEPPTAPTAAHATRALPDATFCGPFRAEPAPEVRRT